MSMIWKTQHRQCQSSSNFFVSSQIFKSNLKKIPLSFSFGENDKLVSKFIQNTSNQE